jgi:hypothetical protein
MSLPPSRTFVTKLLNSLPQLPPSPAGTDANVNATNPAAPSGNVLASVPEGVRKKLLALHVLFPNECLPALDLLDRRLVSRFLIRRKPIDGAAPLGATVAEDAAQATSDLRVVVEKDGARLSPDVATEEAQQPRTQRETSALYTVTAAGRVGSPDAVLGSGVRDPVPLTDFTTQLPQIPIDQARRIEGDGRLAYGDTVYYVRSAQQRSSRHHSSYESVSVYEVRLKSWNCSCPAFAFSAFPSSLSPVATHFDLKDRILEDAAAAAEGMEDGGWAFGGTSLGESMPPVCKHLLACVLVERVAMFRGYVEETTVSVEEAAGWAAGWGD